MSQEIISENNDTLNNENNGIYPRDFPSAN